LGKGEPAYLHVISALLDMSALLRLSVIIQLRTG
jgi:hypothetical protein